MRAWSVIGGLAAGLLVLSACGSPGASSGGGGGFHSSGGSGGGGSGGGGTGGSGGSGGDGGSGGAVGGSGGDGGSGGNAGEGGAGGSGGMTGEGGSGGGAGEGGAGGDGGSGGSGGEGGMAGGGGAGGSGGTGGEAASPADAYRKTCDKYLANAQKCGGILGDDGAVKHFCLHYYPVDPKLIDCLAKAASCDDFTACQSQFVNCTGDNDCVKGATCQTDRVYGDLCLWDECSKDGDCGKDEVCSDAICETSECKVDGDCAAGLECRDSFCWAKRVTDGIVTSCEAFCAALHKLDCAYPASDAGCVRDCSDGYPYATDLISCETNAATCDDVQTCESNFIYPLCETDADCISGAACTATRVGNVCVWKAECAIDGDCATGQGCATGICQVIECQSDADCLGNQGCSEGFCYDFGCTSDFDCPDGYTCIRQACQ